ncbi:hypothetical protein THAOC_13384 [Thalassiosira oceanica]|uniref:RING-type domain-containing protein n=1 Tax=Thalassiosira oceanica TaxID=159749 RepID=K0T5T5_THAOC|nr:hypothetical protein THAOC_13384 [Thalassiosira oceanica]|eukprot:EJK65732.1 hypothetical protein THAOC_13384 [Thalassiosira oceanica]
MSAICLAKTFCLHFCIREVPPGSRSSPSVKANVLLDRERSLCTAASTNTHVTHAPVRSPRELRSSARSTPPSSQKETNSQPPLHRYLTPILVHEGQDERSAGENGKTPCVSTSTRAGLSRRQVGNMSSDESDIEWMASGDRSDPTLQMIDDELVPTLTYDGYQDDVKKLKAAFFEKGAEDYRFVTILFRVQQKQKMHEGDRTHPQLLQLDRLKCILNYAGWEEDFRQAEEAHLESGSRKIGNRFTTACKRLKNRQAIYDGDRSDPWLMRLDSLHLTYHEWGNDVRMVMTKYSNGCAYESQIHTLEERQRVFEGDRSSPWLVALDNLKSLLSYPGYENDDVAAIEEQHFTGIWLSRNVCDKFSSLLKKLRMKQSEYEGFVDLSVYYHPVQRQIIESQWSFHGWEEEVENIRHSKKKDSVFPKELERFRIRQMIHDRDYTRHALLIGLNKLKLSYPGWEGDRKEFESSLCREYDSFLNRHRFKNLMAGMRNKQKAYIRYLRNQLREADGKGLNIGECTICWEADRTHVFIPCGHVCACLSCSRRVMASEKKCPFCNQSATMAVELFFP